MVRAGTMRVDFAEGIVHQTFVTKLYTYERPVGLLHTSGYVAISLGARRQVYAHRLIATVAFGHIPDELVVNHIDGVKHNNRRSNLEVVTPRENTAHAYRLGLARGARKLMDWQVEEVRTLLAAGYGCKEIAEAYGVSSPLVSQIKAGGGRFAQGPARA